MAVVVLREMLFPGTWPIYSRHFGGLDCNIGGQVRLSGKRHFSYMPGKPAIRLTKLKVETWLVGGDNDERLDW